MANYYDASMRIGGPIKEDLFLELIEAIDNDDCEDADYQGLDAASFVGEVIELPCESRAWGDFRETREFCNKHGIHYDLDTENEDGWWRFSFRGDVAALESDWPQNPIQLREDEGLVPVSTLARIVEDAGGNLSKGWNALLRLIESNTPPELEPISLVGSPLCKCDNCGHLAPRSELKDIQDYEQRVDEDGTEPDGECPECGCLAYELAKEANAS